MNLADERRFYDYVGDNTDIDVDCNLLDDYHLCWNAPSIPDYDVMDEMMGYAVMIAYVGSMGCLDSGMT